MMTMSRRATADWNDPVGRTWLTGGLGTHTLNQGPRDSQRYALTPGRAAVGHLSLRSCRQRGGSQRFLGRASVQHDLEISLQLRLGARRPHHHPSAGAGQPDARRCRAAGRSTWTARAGARWPAACARTRPMSCRTDARSGPRPAPTADRSRSGRTPAYSSASSRSDTDEPCRPGAAAARSATSSAGADAVLVAHERRRDGITERLLVAVHEIRRRARDPLEAGERLGVADFIPCLRSAIAPSIDDETIVVA